jgi:DNA mismatch repair protein MutS
MVEMNEAAHILNNATQQSLVLMDEIGRGTSTYDGLALAWACAEKITRDIKANCLFATHYFELTQLPELFDNADNIHLDAVEHGEKIVFMHQVKQGAANQSYGIQVAQLAGVPKDVIDAAKQKLTQLESGKTVESVKQQQSELFEQQPVQTEIEKALKQIQPDNLTAKQALDTLYELVAMLDTKH